MFGLPGSADEDKIFLIDFGLSSRYRFTSRVVHTLVLTLRYHATRGDEKMRLVQGVCVRACVLPQHVGRSNGRWTLSSRVVLSI